MSEIDIEGDYIKINIYSALRDLPAENLLRLADDLSILDNVIHNVTQQIITGWTELGSHGWKDTVGCPEAPLSKAIREVAKMSGEVAKKEIERLEKLYEVEKFAREDLSKWAWRMYYSWPRSHIGLRPELED